MKATSTRRQRRVRGLIAGAAGAALLLAGGTWALWSDSASLEGTKVKAGNLDIASTQPYAYDISDGWTETGGYTGNARTDQVNPNSKIAERAGFECFNLAGSSVPSTTATTDAYVGFPAHAIDLINTPVWHAVPGDTLGIVLPMVVALQGDNLVAELELEVPSGAVVPKGNITLQAADLWVEGVKTPVTLPTSFGGTVSLGFLQAENENYGDDDVDTPPIPVVTNQEIDATDAVNACVVLVPRFEALGPTNQVDTLEDLLTFTAAVKVNLKQTRTPGVGWFN